MYDINGYNIIRGALGLEFHNATATYHWHSTVSVNSFQFRSLHDSNRVKYSSFQLNFINQQQKYFNDSIQREKKNISLHSQRIINEIAHLFISHVFVFISIRFNDFIPSSSIELAQIK